MNVRDLKAHILPALLAGTRRQPLPGVAGLQPDSLLGALSLSGQALRFAMPEGPPEFDVDSWPQDTRRVLPESVRPRMLRLLNANRCTDDSELAVALACSQLRLRPHPFDLPKLDGFVRRHSQHLGVAAQYWAQRDTKTESRKGYFDEDGPAAENWTEVPIAVRVAYLERQREHDPAAARSALEQVWPGEPADARVRLIGALQTGLREDDRAFLEAALKDRAPRVRMIAYRMAARLGGSPANNPSLAACLERIQKEKTGVLKRRVALKLELPANVKENTANRWIREQFADVTFDELAGALEIPIASLVAAAKDDQNLLFALAMVATTDRRFHALAEIANELPDAWGRMSESGFDEFSFADEQREHWVESIVRPREWMPEPALPAWGWLLRRIQSKLPEKVMRDVLKSKWWSDQLGGEKKPGTEVIQLFCALCPAGLRDKLREQIDELDADRKEVGLMLLDTLDGLEAVQ
ncbi:MAG TPA: DUF5691 domain-containing protein [Terracidiphilus sp.]|nr:DUF5691 domain-containing protein [Terracidiphilus sp.]